MESSQNILGMQSEAPAAGPEDSREIRALNGHRNMHTHSLRMTSTQSFIHEASGEEMRERGSAGKDEWLIMGVCVCVCVTSRWRQSKKRREKEPGSWQSHELF